MIATTVDTTPGHDALLAAIEDARQHCDRLWHRVLTADSDAYPETMEAWTLCNVRYTTLIEAGVIFTLGPTTQE